MFKIYGNRNVSIMRELTKTYEEIILSDLEKIQSIITNRIENNMPLKGEIVIVVEGYKFNQDLNINEIKKNINEKLINFSLRDTVNMIVSETGLSKKVIYNEAIKLNNKK
jgi:16S rRNA (cytidine1402-2'-O)-methyltransferase